MNAGARVRSVRDGQLGRLVESDTGHLLVRLDRRVETLVPFIPALWVPDAEPRLTALQVARIGYDADRALRLALGEYNIPDWTQLREPVRLEWMRKGVPEVAPELRRKLAAAITKAVTR